MALSISRAWDETKARIASDGRLMVIVAAALLLLPQALVSVLAPPEQLSGEKPPELVNLLALLAGMIGLVAQVAIIRLALVQSTSVGEAISHGLRRFLPVFVAAILLMVGLFLLVLPLMLLAGAGGELAQGDARPASVLIAVGLLLLVAILIGPRFLMLMPVATAERGGPIHILKRSWEISKGHYLRLLGFMLLILVAAIIIVGAVQLVAGALLAGIFDEIDPLSFGALLYGLIFGALQALFGVILSVMLARMYVQLSGAEAADVSVPNSGT